MTNSELCNTIQAWILSIRADSQNKIAAGWSAQIFPVLGCKSICLLNFRLPWCIVTKLNRQGGNPHPSPAMTMMFTCVENEWNSWRHKYGPTDVKSRVQAKWERNNKMTTSNCRWRCERFATKIHKIQVYKKQVAYARRWCDIKPMNEWVLEWVNRFWKKTVCVSKPNSIAIFLDRWTYENSRCYPHVESVSNLAWTSWRKLAAR